ncbi:transporter [Pandoraea pnomenusa]|uniref:SphA family protein n=1 Tax=Pandoraea pnomenusa TaxID=93220 RepID=UPI00333E9608
MRSWFASVAIALAMLSFASREATASEGFVYGGINGGADIGAAYLPPEPGFYGLVIAGTAHATSLYGNDGKKIDGAQFGLHVYSALGGLMYVYPFKLGGGTLASTIVEGFGGTYSLTAYGQSGRASGIGDLYSDLLIWSKHIGGDCPETMEQGRPGLPYGLTVRLAYSMFFPTGAYNPNSAVGSLGHNVYFFIPNASVTYLTGPNRFGDGTEFSLTVWYDKATRNRATDYQTGDVIDFDWAISERMGKWQVGVAGNYATQLNGDRKSGQLVNGNGDRLGAATIGPVVAYQIPQWKSIVKLKVGLPIWARNYNNAITVYGTLMKAF